MLWITVFSWVFQWFFSSLEWSCPLLWLSVLPSSKRLSYSERVLSKGGVILLISVNILICQSVFYKYNLMRLTRAGHIYWVLRYAWRHSFATAQVSCVVVWSPTLNERLNICSRLFWVCLFGNTNTGQPPSPSICAYNFSQKFLKVLKW